jgi:prepilin-type N-terminal cleavage/methylation domain-containing protein
MTSLVGRARRPQLAPSDPRGRRGFSLIEILVTVALLSVIIIGLVAIFGQTQQAFRAGLAQTDVQESGRALTDMLAREFEEIRPTYAAMPTANFYSDVNPNILAPAVSAGPLLQGLPGNTASPQLRTNVVDDLYFLSRYNRQWTLTGYTLVGAAAGFGTLYRWQTNLPAAEIYKAPGLFNQFRSKPTDWGQPVADGLVHFRIRTYDTNDLWITSPKLLPKGDWYGTNQFSINMWTQPRAGGEAGCIFYSNAIPTAVDLEIGILTPRTLARARALPNAALQRTYLSNHVDSVQLFRQRVSLRNVDPEGFR